MDGSCICKIRNVYRAVLDFEKELGRLFGLNLNEMMLLCILSERGEMHPGEIAGQMGLSNSNASKVISGLEKKGLLSRKLCKQDKRCMTFSLTASARKIIENLAACENKMPEFLKSI